MIEGLPPWAWSLLLATLSVLVALAVHTLVVGLAGRFAKRSASSTDDVLVLRMKGPLRWLLIVLALGAVQPALDLSQYGLQLWSRISGLVVPGLIGWMALAGLTILVDIIKMRSDISAADNLRARRRRTRADILYRVGMFVILVATFCMMLMSIPSIRNIGVTLIASAGLAALAVGAAAQPALKNLIGGLQMALTEPVRIDDVVIIDGEWGRIEEIRLTYVVIKVWDERRLVVPLSKFLEESFQNWTRQTSDLTGAVVWHLDPAADIPRLRAKLEELVRANPRWDGRFCNLQVTEMRVDAIEVRALMTARDASLAFDLRCDVREAMLAFIRDEMPEALVRRRHRAEIEPSPAPVR